LNGGRGQSPIPDCQLKKWVAVARLATRFHFRLPIEENHPLRWRHGATEARPVLPVRVATSEMML
jgi:hypothetical protein